MIQLRRSSLIAVLLALLLAPTGLAQAQTLEIDATVNTGALNVRSGPGLGFSVVAVIFEGTEVTAIGRDASAVWAFIVTDGVSGWVGNDFIDPRSSSDDFFDLPIIESDVYQARVTTAVLNIRSGPGFDFAVLGTAPFGTYMNLLGRNSDASWAFVEFGGLNSPLRGWVGTGGIESDVDLFILPVISTVDTPTVVPPSPTEVVISTPVGGGGGDTTPTGNTAIVVEVAALNVRSGPGLNYGIITSVGNGGTVTMLARSTTNRWVQVQLPDGTVGWMSATYLLYNSVAFAELPVQDTSAPTGVVTTGALNVRSGPSTSFSVITAVPQGTILSLLGRNSNGSWVYVALPTGGAGWVSSFYLETSVDVLTLPYRP